MSPKTPRELVADLYENQKTIDETYRYPDKYTGFGWSNERIRSQCSQQVEIIRRSLRVEQQSGGMEKETIHLLLEQARKSSDFDEVNGIQVRLQNAAKTYVLEDEETSERRRGMVAELFLQFYCSGGSVTPDLVEALCQQIGG